MFLAAGHSWCKLALFSPTNKMSVKIKKHPDGGESTIKTFRIHPVGTMNIKTKFQCLLLKKILFCSTVESRLIHVKTTQPERVNVSDTPSETVSKLCFQYRLRIKADDDRNRKHVKGFMIQSWISCSWQSLWQLKVNFNTEVHSYYTAHTHIMSVVLKYLCVAFRYLQLSGWIRHPAEQLDMCRLQQTAGRMWVQRSDSTFNISARDSSTAHRSVSGLVTSQREQLLMERPLVCLLRLQQTRPSESLKHR